MTTALRVPLGQHPAPHHVIAHVSDTHLLAQGRLLHGSVDTELHLARAMEQLERIETPPRAIVFTGDLADLAEPEAYERLTAIVEPSAERMGAEIVWVIGNHDEREQYAESLFGDEPTSALQNRVHDIDGLRVISFDTTVRGYHHGEVTDEGLEWLAEVLSEPAEHGSILAVHHPPVPTPLLWAMEILELRGQDRLERVIAGSDIRAILGGHLHLSTHSMFAGIPVSVAAATCYTMQVTAPGDLLGGVDANQSVDLVHVYDDRIVHTTVPIAQNPQVSGFSENFVARIVAMSDHERLEQLSRKGSSFPN